MSDSVVNTTGFCTEEYFDNSSHLRNESFNQELKQKLWDEITKQTELSDKYLPEYQSKTKSGENIWLWEKGKIVKDELQKPIYIEGFVMDITNSKLSRLELEKTKNSLQLASKIAKIGSWIWMVDNNLMEWDEEFTNILETPHNSSQEQVLNRLQTLLHPFDRLIYNEFQNKNYLPTETKTFHQRLLFPTKVKHIDSIVNPILNQNNEVIGLHGIIQDVSNQKNIITQLDDEKIKFKTIMDTLNVVIWEIDFKQGKVKYVSPKADIIFGGDFEDWSNIAFWQKHIFDKETTEQISNLFNVDLSTNFKEVEFELEISEKKKKWVRNVITFSNLENSQLIRGVLIDITDKKNIEREKFEMQRRVELLADNMPGFLFQLHIAPPHNKILYVSDGIKKVFKKNTNNC